MANYWRDYDRRNAAGSAGTAQQSGIYWQPPGLNFAPEYQVSGFPAVYHLTASTGNDDPIVFPLVTQWIIITHKGTNDSFISFTANAYDADEKSDENTTNGNAKSRFLLPRSSVPVATPKLEIKCTKLYVQLGSSCEVTIMAGLTNIQPQHMPALSGSGAG
tara:strand:- start:56 stop:538 length:483 start_codon:yes stop_codon:yes gene_type:complete